MSRRSHWRPPLVAVILFVVVTTVLAGTAGAREMAESPVIFGDSLTVDAAEEFERSILTDRSGELDAATVWAADGWSLASWERTVHEVVDQGPPLIAFALGTNDSLAPKVSLRAWKRVLDHLEVTDVCVSFVRPHRSTVLNAAQLRFMDDLDTLVAQYPDVQVVDWEAFASQRRNVRLHTDGVHHNRALQEFYAEYLAGATSESCR